LTLDVGTGIGARCAVIGWRQITEDAEVSRDELSLDRWVSQFGPGTEPGRGASRGPHRRVASRERRTGSTANATGFRRRRT